MLKKTTHRPELKVIVSVLVGHGQDNIFTATITNVNDFEKILNKISKTSIFNEKQFFEYVVKYWDIDMDEEETEDFCYRLTTDNINIFNKYIETETVYSLNIFILENNSVKLNNELGDYENYYDMKYMFKEINIVELMNIVYNTL